MNSLPQGLAEALLPWYDAHKRPLPWRQNPTPYRVWVSEIMLQQTRIEAVRGYFDRFMAALPTVEELAAAEEETVLKLWEGLGYYSRARNLRRAAQIIAAEYGGQLPADVKALRALPGVGDYTAGAIASIAFGLPEPAVDGNVLRICARLTACGESIADGKVKRRFHEALKAQYPSERCGDVTSAIMELGETVCLPGTPDCDSCPLKDKCLAMARGRQTDYPVMPEKRPRQIQPRTVFILTCQGRTALCRRPDKGLLAGLWELPNVEGRLDEQEALAQAAAWGCGPVKAAPCGEAVHIFTHLEWHMTGWRIECAAAPERFVWAEAGERERYPIPTAFRAYRSQLC
ncbi:MAG: A/G-specific adenine glycosylase [Oscillospiraceae bacterium]|nr:A/G-specific adenine glycosylase [Oscillospiraceae bacterium]